MSDENVTNNSGDAQESAPDNADVKENREESFAALLEKSSGQSERLAPGQKVRAKVVSISGDLVYIDLGGKSEGVVDLNEFAGEGGTPNVSEGDEIEAFFVTVQDGARRLTTLVNGYSAATLNSIRDAHEGGLPVNGDVKREVKGGFEISVGGVRCFCPFSQIDLKGGREGGIYLGRTFPFKVLEFEENGRNIILSRRAMLEAERQARVEKLKETLSLGMEVTGTVRSIQNFGAFVDLGGIDGLIPLSEMSWDRSAKPGDLLSVGQQVLAKIIGLDWERNRLTLSVKALQPDPWVGAAERYPVDGKATGTIVRLLPFGAFLQLEPGVEGLIHISNLGAGRRINHPKEVVEAGQVVEVYILSVDIQNRKISLSMQPKPKQEKIVLPEEGEIVEGVVDKVMPFGVFVKLSSGLSGLIPNSELGETGEQKRVLVAGERVQTVVSEIDPATKKIRLSRKAVTDKEAKKEYEQYIDSSRKPESSGGLGSLGELLKARMEEKKLSGA